MDWTDLLVAVRGPRKVEQAVCGLLHPQVHYFSLWWGLAKRIKAPVQLGWDCVTYL